MSEYSKKNQGPALNPVKPQNPSSPQAGVNTGKRGAHETLGILSNESPKNVWKPNAGGRK